VKLFVIMSNDFPAGVMDDGAKAEAFCRTKNAADKNRTTLEGRSRIYWVSYEFTLGLIKQ